MSYISLSYWLISKPTLSTQHYLLPLRKSSSPFQQFLTMLLSPSITPYLSLFDFLPLYLSFCLSLFVSLSLYLCLFLLQLFSITLSTYLSLSLSLSFYIHTSQSLSLSLSFSLYPSSPSALERAALAKAKTCCCPAERFVPPVVLYVRVEKKMI